MLKYTGHFRDTRDVYGVRKWQTKIPLNTQKRGNVIHQIKQVYVDIHFWRSGLDGNLVSDPEQLNTDTKTDETTDGTRCRVFKRFIDNLMIGELGQVQLRVFL